MMKRILFLLVVLCPFNILYAQITITSADMPSVNDVYTYSYTNDAQGNDPALTGANYTWDYSALTYTTQSSDTFFAVTSTPLAYQFYFNNAILYNAWKANYATKGIDLGIPQVPITDVFNYHKNSSSAYSNVGFGANISGVPSSTRNNPIDEEYAFPVSYGATHQSNSKYEVNVPTFGTYGQSMERVDTVDGWGPLTTPYGTFDCIRVKSTLYKIDTTYIDAISFGTTTPRPEEIEYKWLTNGKGTPVLKITTISGTITNIQYQDSLHTIGIKEEQVVQINVFPNPSNSYVAIDFHAQRAEKVMFFIKDQLGRIVGQELHPIVSGKNRVLFNLLKYHLPKGIYFLDFTMKGQHYSQKIVFNE